MTMNIMRKINPKSCNEDSFKYSVLISLHYYDINFHPEKVTKLKAFENKYNFNHTTPNEFDINNRTFHSQYLMIKIIQYTHQIIKVLIKLKQLKLKDNSYAAIKPLKNTFIELNELLKSFSHQS